MNRHLTAAAIALGMAMWWPFLRTSITGFLFVDGSLPGGYACFVSIALAVLAVSVLAPPHVADAPLSWRLAVPAAGILASAGNVLAWSSLGGQVGFVISETLFAVAYVLFPTAWALLLRRVYRQDMHAVLVVVLASYILSFVFGYLSYLPQPWSLIRPLGAPLLCAVLFTVATNLYERDEHAASAGAREAGRATESSCAGQHHAERFATGDVTGDASLVGGGWNSQLLYACIIAVYLVGSIPIGFIQTGSPEYVPSFATFVRDTLNILVVGCLLAAVLIARHYEHLPLAAIMLLTTLTLVGIAVASVLQSDWSALGWGLVATGTSCLSVLVFAIAWARMQGNVPMMRTMGLLLTLPALVRSLISSVLVPTLVGGNQALYVGFWGIGSLLLGALINACLVTMLAVLALRPPQAQAMATHKGAGARPASPWNLEGTAAPVSAIARQYGLTEREEQIVSLLCGGNTFARIGDILALSPSTVQTHSKSIYRKLGIHSKQELVDLVAGKGR